VAVHPWIGELLSVLSLPFHSFFIKLCYHEVVISQNSEKLFLKPMAVNRGLQSAISLSLVCQIIDWPLDEVSSTTVPRFSYHWHTLPGFIARTKGDFSLIDGFLIFFFTFINSSFLFTSSL
jgi:hypothetical protein